MKSAEAALNTEAYGAKRVLYMAIEMSKTTWKLGSSDGSSIREKNCAAGDFEALMEEVERAKRRFKLPADCEVVAVYEAGRDGFWPQRCLEAHGVRTLIMDPASLLSHRRRRPVKTDRVDVKRMVRALIAYEHGDEQMFAVCRVPSAQDEDDRHIERHREMLNTKRTAVINQIRSLMRLQNFDDVKIAKLTACLDDLRTADGQPLGPHVKRRLRDLCEQLELLQSQLARVQKEREEVKLQRQGEKKFEKMARLAQLKGIGDVTAWSLVMEMYGWRNFQTRGQVGAYCGLTSSPWTSGTINHDQGLSNSGNTHVRWILIQLAWRWLRFQPDSELSEWFRERVANGKSKKKMIVGLARKLAIRLGKYLDCGELPRGAVLKQLK